MKYLMKTSLAAISLLALCACTTRMDIQTLNNRAMQLMNSGDTDGAIARLESINDLDPNYAQTHYNLGIAYYNKKQYQKALGQLQDATRINPKLADAYFTLGVIYEDMASKEVEENKGNDPVKIYNFYVLSQQNYDKYLKTNENASDKEEITQKINDLETEIQKYQSKLPISQNYSGN